MMNDDIIECPFCSSLIDQPREIKTNFGNTFEGGKCECGVVYVFDRSGHNLGEAYIDAMNYACEGDPDKAWSLIPDKDYEIREMSFDVRRKKLSERARKNAATYVFIMIKKDKVLTNKKR